MTLIEHPTKREIRKPLDELTKERNEVLEKMGIRIRLLRDNATTVQIRHQPRNSIGVKT